ncbi:hypothetical protein D9M72_596550 [compost metagenome]
MWPCEFAQRQNQICARTQSRIVPVRAANGDNQLAFAIITHTANAFSKSFRAERFAALVEQDKGSAP